MNASTRPESSTQIGQLDFDTVSPKQYAKTRVLGIL